MTYDELKNGLKSLFSTLGAKTSDSNYGVALLDKTSGEPKGLMGMSSLASVLGGLTLYHYIEYNNFQSPINIGKAIGLVIVISSATGNYAASLCSTISDPIPLRTSGVISITGSDQNTIATCTNSDSLLLSRPVFVIVIGRIV